MADRQIQKPNVSAAISAESAVPAGPALGGLNQWSGRRRFPPLAVWIIAGLCVAAIVAVRFVLDIPKLDAAVRNIVTLILGFVAAMSLLVWFSWRSAYPRGVRLALPALLAALALTAAATLKPDHVDSALVPRFRWRWQPKADQLLPPVRTTVEQPAVDLAAVAAGDFPQFLGPNRNLSVDGLELAIDWQARPPKRIWSQPIGAGWSAFAVVGAHAVTLEQRGSEELVSCYNLHTGAVEWAEGIQARHETTLGGVGPRSTPTIADGKVYALGGTGVLRCLEGATGHVIWTHDLLKEFGVASSEADMEAIAWGRAGSPLLVDNLVVVPAGGPSGGPFVSLVAYDRETSSEVWRGGDRQIGYASPALATLGGRRQIVSVNEDDISGHDPQTGKRLWHIDWPGVSNRTANASQAVPIDDHRLLVSKGYGGGAMLFEVVAGVDQPAPGGDPLTSGDDAWTAREIWRNPRVLQTKFTNIAVRGGYAYGLSDGILECIDVEHGARQWKNGRFGHGQILRVGDRILILAESGELALVEANPERFVELARVQAIEGKTWNNLALAGPLLLVRNAEQAACFELPLAAGGHAPRAQSHRGAAFAQRSAR
jgi:outer membrane protein assembly factor BamB